MGSASIVPLSRVCSGLRGPTTFRSSVRRDVHGPHNHTEFLRPDEKSRGLPPHRLIHLPAFLTLHEQEVHRAKVEDGMAFRWET